MIHSFTTEIALEIGVNEAIVLNHLYYWVHHNKTNNINFYEGRYWTYNSIGAFTRQFPFFTQAQIRRILNKLKDNGIIDTGNFNKNNYDRTIWYTLTQKGLCLLGDDEGKGWLECSNNFIEDKSKNDDDAIDEVSQSDTSICQNRKVDVLKTAHGNIQNEQMDVSELAHGCSQNDKWIFKKQQMDFHKMTNGFGTSDTPIPYYKHNITQKITQNKTGSGGNVAVVAVDDKDNNEVNDNNNNSTPPEKNDFSNLLKIYQENIKANPGKLEMTELFNLYQQYGYQWLYEAIKIAIFSGKVVGIKYIQGILQSWQAKFAPTDKPWLIESEITQEAAAKIASHSAAQNTRTNSIEAASKAIAILEQYGNYDEERNISHG